MHPATPLDRHRCHDYRDLIARWRRVAKASGLRLRVLAESGGYPVYYLQTRNEADGGLYVSAGIHGDEPAGTEGLVTWAEKYLPKLAREGWLPVTLLPCLNPWGLINNQRADAQGNDLNRVFNREDLPPVGELKRLLAHRRYALAVHLHEDYDAQGIYLYELTTHTKSWGHDLLAACAQAIPVDPRPRIDARRFHRGVWLRRRVLTAPIYPEARFLFPRHCPLAMTFETPSELGLSARTQAQLLLLEECTFRLLDTGPPS